MFNNKRRLLSAFITAMMLCPITNGTEKVKSNKTDWSKIDCSRVVRGFKTKKKAYIREFAGLARKQLLQKYVPIDNDKVFAGHSGVVSQFKRRSDGKVVAVKCVVNPDIMKTFNNEENHVEDHENELKFYQDAQSLWKNSPWALEMYDFIEDEKDKNVYYIVTEWVDGVTLYNWIKDLFKKESDVVVIMKKLLPVFVKFIDIVKDMYKNNRSNDDLHLANVMVQTGKNDEDIILRVVDNGHYVEAEDLETSMDCALINVRRLLCVSATRIRSKYSDDHCSYEFKDDTVKDCYDACIVNNLQKTLDIYNAMDINKLDEIINEIKKFINKYDKKNI